MIQFYEDEAGEWRFRILGTNGETVASSEGYTRKEDAQRGYATLWAIIVQNAPASFAVGGRGHEETEAE